MIGAYPIASVPIAATQDAGGASFVSGAGLSYAYALSQSGGDPSLTGHGYGMSLVYSTVTVAAFSYSGTGESWTLANGRALGSLPATGRNFGPALQSG